MALLRYYVVSQVRALLLRGVPRSEAVAEVAAQLHPTASGASRSVSRRSIYRWLACVEASGADSLESGPRTTRESSLALSEQLVSFAIEERRQDDEASVPELIKRARAQGVISENKEICRQTLYRVLKRKGVCMRRRKAQRGRDARRFEYPHRMDMLLCDGKHFRAGPKRLRRMAYFFLDDACRFVLNVVVGTSENSRLFLRGLYETIRRWGAPTGAYLDRGPGFIARDTAEVCRKLDVSLVIGASRYPEGRGKIERFNRTAKKDLLRHLTRPDVNPDCAALELRLRHYTQEVYNHTENEGLPYTGDES